MNRRGFLGFLGAAPLGLPAAVAAAAAAPMIIGIDGGGSDDVFSVGVLRGEKWISLNWSAPELLSMGRMRS
jgi:hypothetical protein